GGVAPRCREQRRHWRGRGLLVGLVPERAGVVYAVHVVVPVLVIGERQPVGLAGPREGGRQRRDPGDTREDGGQLIRVVVADVLQVDVADPGSVRDEGDRPPVEIGRAHV